MQSIEQLALTLLRMFRRTNLDSVRIHIDTVKHIMGRTRMHSSWMQELDDLMMELEKVGFFQLDDYTWVIFHTQDFKHRPFLLSDGSLQTQIVLKGKSKQDHPEWFEGILLLPSQKLEMNKEAHKNGWNIPFPELQKRKRSTKDERIASGVQGMKMTKDQKKRFDESKEKSK